MPERRWACRVRCGVGGSERDLLVKRTGRADAQDLGVTFAPLDMKAAALAGDAWRSYRRRGGERERVIADFLVGAHARSQADRLLTRDRGFYRSAFSGLRLVEPTAR